MTGNVTGIILIRVIIGNYNKYDTLPGAPIARKRSTNANRVIIRFVSH